MLNTTTARGTSVIEIGAGVAGLAAPRRAIRTGWNSDPFSLGAHSFAAVNASSEDHVTLAKPSGSRLLHAGEHTHELYRATVHGAFLTGEREARRIIAARSNGTNRPKRR